MVKMKDFTEQDQQITREFDKYRLSSPSPELHDRVLRAALEAWSIEDARLHWTSRWLRVCVSFRQEILAFASALMLILGAVMQLGGGESVLADSIERWTVMTAVSGSLYRATSMDCTMLKPGAEGESFRYRVRWSADGVTRIDMNPTEVIEQTVWISEGTVSTADSADGTVRSTAIATMPYKWQPPMEILTPTILAQHLERYGLLQAERPNSAGPGELLLIGHADQQVVEIAIDAKTSLPTTLKRFSTHSARNGMGQVCLEEIRFQWNEPIPGELLVPKSSAVKLQLH